MLKKNASKETIPLFIKILQSLFSTFGPIFPRALGKLMVRLWFTTTRYKIPRVEKSVAAQAEKDLVDVDGLAIRTWSWGKGPVILFLHGWSGRGTQIASFVQPLVDAGFKVLAFDGPAHGQTPGKTTTIYEYSKVLNALMNDIGPLHGVITHSFGAMVFAYTYTSNTPVERIVFISPPSTVEQIIKNFQRLLHIPEQPTYYFKKTLKQTFGDNIFKKLSTKNNVKKFSTPGLIIHDEEDLDLNWEESQHLSEAWKQSSFIKTQGLGHIKILYDKEVIQQVTKFMMK